MGIPVLLYGWTQEELEELVARCKAAILEGLGTVSVSISGGGESETRETMSGMSPAALLRMAMQALHVLDPETYPAAVARTIRPDFRATTL